MFLPTLTYIGTDWRSKPQLESCAKTNCVANDSAQIYGINTPVTHTSRCQGAVIQLLSWDAPRWRHASPDLHDNTSSRPQTAIVWCLKAPFKMAFPADRFSSSLRLWRQSQTLIAVSTTIIVTVNATKTKGSKRAIFGAPYLDVAALVRWQFYSQTQDN